MSLAVIKQLNEKAIIKVLVVDDSPSICKLMEEIINREPDMKVVGTAPDPLLAREMIKALNPDVVTLDIEMPRMNGLDFLEKLMRLHPVPVLMVSSLTAAGSEATLRALELGAMDVVLKPHTMAPDAIDTMAEDITGKLRRLLQSRHNLAASAAGALPPAEVTAAVSPALAARKVIFIGSSTGGTEAVRNFLCMMPVGSPAILIAQHLPEAFTGAFARRLDASCQLTVKEAVHNERIRVGHVYVAPGHSHLMVCKVGGHCYTYLSNAEPVNRHRPSVDVLFESAARHVGKNAIGVILTGMGKDGAAGMLKMREAGAHTLAQDQSSCVVFGMPKAAIELKGVQEVLPLSDLPKGVLKQLVKPGEAGRP
jgi:two-component system, chemotaxis family, protein-glutamate methylesterase/glutaminase